MNVGRIGAVQFAVESERVFVVSEKGAVACLDLNTGNIRRQMHS